MNPVVLGKTCRCGPDCDPLIVHQDELEAQLAALFDEHNPMVTGNNYLVIDTMERQTWRESLKQPKGIQEMMEHLHISKEVRTIEYRPAGWYPADEPLVQDERAEKPVAQNKPRTGRKRKRSKR
jgi:hypothetical protein